MEPAQPGRPPLGRIDGYEVLGGVARGAGGVVLRARDPKLDREVALKLFHGELDPARLERFRREAEALALLRHPNVLNVHDAGVHEGRPYLVLPFVAGESLGSALARGPLPIEQALELAEALAHALAAVHAAGLVHRDVKPDNVLLTPEGHPLLTDFGLAKQEDSASLSRTGAFMGTPGYWSPEQAGGEGLRAGPASDVYSLGATLFALLTGEPPFSAGSVMDLALLTTRAPAPPPSSLRSEVSPALDRLVLRCLAKQPEERFASADELAAALAAVREQRGGRAGRRLLVGASAALCLSLAALGALALRGGGPDQAEASPTPTSSAAGDLQPSAAQLLAQARAAREEARWEEALQLAARAAALDPEQAAPEQARQHLERRELNDVLGAAARAPLDPEARTCAALACVVLGRWREGDEAAQQAVAFGGEQAHPLAARGLLRVVRRRHEEGLADLERAVTLAPGDPLVWAIYAQAQLAQDAPLLAAKAAARGKGSLLAGWIELDALCQAKQDHAARSRADELMAQHGPCAATWLARGRARLLAEESAAALRDVEAALKRCPKSPWAHAHRADAHWKQARFPETEADYDRAIELGPDLSELSLLRALTRINRQNFAGALEEYDRILARDPQHPLVLQLRAAALVGLDRMPEALEDLRKQVARQPKSAKAWKLLLIVAAHAGEREEALRANDRLVALEPDDPQHYLQRAELLSGLGRLPAAREDLQRALELDPESEQAREALERLSAKE